MKKIFVMLLIAFLCSCDSTDRIDRLERATKRLEIRIDELENRIDELNRSVDSDVENLRDRFNELISVVEELINTL
jgi:flagellar capping protein FliD